MKRATKARPEPFNAEVWIKGAEAAGVPCTAVIYPHGERAICQNYENPSAEADQFGFGPLPRDQLSAVVVELERQGKSFHSSLPTLARQRAAAELRRGKP